MCFGKDSETAEKERKKKQENKSRFGKTSETANKNPARKQNLFGKKFQNS